MRAGRVASLALASACTACAAIAGISEFEPVDCVGTTCGPDDAATDAHVAPVDADASATDAISATDATDATDGALDGDTDDLDGDVEDATEAGPCDPTPPESVLLPGGQAIDATEVTNAQYAAFLAARAGDTSGQPVYCAWNSTYVPVAGWPASPSTCDQPVTHVDWCDAFAYCKWAKKRLCGHPSGGPVAYAGTGYATAAGSQWFAACSAGGTTTWPYGSTYAPGACVDDAYDGKAGTAATDVERAVRAAAACRGASEPYASIHDLAGNVREWEDGCDGIKDGADDCRARGGSYAEAFDKSSCAGAKTYKRKDAAADVGFRCCSP